MNGQNARKEIWEGIKKRFNFPSFFPLFVLDYSNRD